MRLEICLVMHARVQVTSRDFKVLPSQEARPVRPWPRLRTCRTVTRGWSTYHAVLLAAVPERAGTLNHLENSTFPHLNLPFPHGHEAYVCSGHR